MSPATHSKLCKVCGDQSSGKHYGIYSCHGCAAFFKRFIRRNVIYTCAYTSGSCKIDKDMRTKCRSCRLQKCLNVGMLTHAVQPERGLHTKIIQQSHIHQGLLPLVTFPPAMRNAALLRPTPPLVERRCLEATIYIMERAAKLLIGNIEWAKNQSAFISLPMDDQLLLVEKSWKGLLMLAIVKFMMPINISQLLFVYQKEHPNIELFPNFEQQVQLFQYSLHQMDQLNIDSTEYEYLRSIKLYKISSPATTEQGISGQPINNGNASPGPSSPMDLRRLREPVKVAALRREAYCALSRYITCYHPTEPLRLETLLNILSMVGGVSSVTINELLFRRGTNGFNIINAVLNMYRDEARRPIE